MKRLLILGVSFLATTTLPVSIASAQSIACASEVPAARGGHWYYRIIDGRKCWYQGKPMMPKTSLHWPKSSGSEAKAAEPVAEDRGVTAAAKPTTDGRNVSGTARPTTDGRSLSAPPPSAPSAPAAWPSPVKDVMDDQSFESRWRGLRPDG
jgi:hypothetical protein